MTDEGEGAKNHKAKRKVEKPETQEGNGGDP